MKQDASNPSISALLPGLTAVTSSPEPKALDLALLRLYVDNHRLDRVLVPLMALTAGLLLSFWLPVTITLLWVLISISFTLGCLRVYERFDQNADALSVQQWTRRIALIHGGLILNWSSIGLWAWIPGNFANHLSIAVMLLGLIATTTAMSTPHLRLFLLDMAPPTLVLVIRPLLEGESVYALIAGMAVCFVLLMFHVGNQIHSNLLKMVKLQMENQQLIRQLENMATTDPLTGVSNRRYFLLAANEELQRCRRYRHAITLMMIDVDHFKAINDAHGHAMGDMVLRKLSEILVGELRRSDQIGRLGGEEFALLLPETNLAMASLIAERIRTKVAATPFHHNDRSTRLTLSIGLAENGPEISSLEGLMERADKRMYQAKQLGRNRVVTGSEAAPRTAAATLKADESV